MASPLRMTIWRRIKINWGYWLALGLLVAMLTAGSGCSYLSAKNTVYTPVFNQQGQLMVGSDGKPLTTRQELTDEAAYYQAQLMGAQIASQPIFKLTFPDQAQVAGMQAALANPNQATPYAVANLLAGASLEVRAPHNGQIGQYRSEWANWIPVLAMAGYGAFTVDRMANVAVAGFGAARGTVNNINASQQAGVQVGSPGGQVNTPTTTTTTTSTDDHSVQGAQ